MDVGSMAFPGHLDAVCDALISRLLPALQPVVEQAASKAALLAVQSLQSDSQ